MGHLVTQTRTFHAGDCSALIKQLHQRVPNVTRLVHEASHLCLILPSADVLPFSSSCELVISKPFISYIGMKDLNLSYQI
jgi:hypothetical protein